MRVVEEFDEKGDPLSDFMAGFMAGANPIFHGIAGAAVDIAKSIGIERPHHSIALQLVDELNLNTAEDLSLLRRYVSPVIQRAIAARTLEVS